MIRRILDEIPLFNAIRALSRRGARTATPARAPINDRGALAFYIAIGAVASVSLAAPFSRALTSQLIAVHHFRPTSWPAWGALQIVPKMYSFAHRCWIGPTPLLEQEPISVSESRFDRESFWVNHYPVRRARFDGNRSTLGVGSTRFVYVQTTYFGQTETTGLRVTVGPEGLTFSPRRLREAP